LVPSESLFFLASNCAGNAFVAIENCLVRQVAIRADDTGTPVTAFFPRDPTSLLGYQSIEDVVPPGNPCTNGTLLSPTRCCHNVSGVAEAGPAQPIDVSGYTPPFSTAR
jgi:hypothetical protein